MKRYAALLVVLATLVLPGPALAQAPHGALVIPAGQHVTGTVATVTQNILVEGEVTGDVTSWSGDIVVHGRVGGDVVSYGGQVRIAATARVEGHVLAMGGLQYEPGAHIAGQVIGSEGGQTALAGLVDLFTSPQTGVGSAVAVGRALFGAALGVLLLAFCLLCAAFWPRRTAIAGVVLQHLPQRSLALGLLTTLIAALVLPAVIVLLAATLIGIPVIVLLLALVQLPYVFGLAVLAQAGAASLAGQGRPAAPTGPALLLGAAGPALLIAIVTALAPLWGLALFYLLASPGLGAAILSRGGLLTLWAVTR